MGKLRCQAESPCTIAGHLPENLAQRRPRIVVNRKLHRGEGSETGKCATVVKLDVLTGVEIQIEESHLVEDFFYICCAGTVGFDILLFGCIDGRIQAVAQKRLPNETDS